MNPQTSTTMHDATSWVCAGLTLLIVMLVVVYAVPLWQPSATQLEAPDTHEFLAATAVLCKPEPLEQARYVVAVVLTPLLFMGLLALLRKRVLVTPQPAADGGRLILAAVGLQILLAGFVFAQWDLQYRQLYKYFVLADMAQLFFAGTLSLALGWLLQQTVLRAREQAGSATSPTRSAWLPALLGLAFVASQLASSVFTERNLATTPWLVRYHVPFVLGEFAAVVDGRVPLVDLFPQYQSLVALLVLPLFKLFGMSVTSFTLVMALLSCIGLCAAFAAFWQYARNGWLALLVFLPFVAMSIFPTGNYGIQRQTTYNYYALPLRYLGPWLVVCVGAWALRRASRASFIVLAALASLVALNNLDFGVPAWVGALAIYVVSNTQHDWLRPSVLARRAALFIAVALGVALLHALLLLLFTGHLPLWSHIARYQRAFAVAGFMMLPMPSFGLHFVIFVTFMAAIFHGYTLRHAANGASDDQLRLRAALLIWSGVFGCGAGMYYVGRSHELALPAIFSAWSFALGLLSLELGRGWSRLWAQLTGPDPSARASAKQKSTLLFLPSAVGAWLMLASGSALLRSALPSDELARLRIDDQHYLAFEHESVAFLRSHTTPGEQVMIVYPFGHLLALQAKLDNLYPYAHIESLLTRLQVDDVLAVLRRAKVGKLFGNPPPELASALSAAGYRRVEAAVMSPPAAAIADTQVMIDDKALGYWAK